MDDVTICNMALGHVRARNKVLQVHPTPDDSEEARQCHIYYHTARRATLEAADWGFASREGTIALYAGDTTPTRWDYQYAWPTGCIAPREIIRESADNDTIAFAEGLSSDETTRLIYTDEATASLRFTADIENPALFDPSFVQALAWRLAMDLAIPISGREKVFGAAQSGFETFIRKAKVYSANKMQTRQSRNASWHRGRQ